MSQNPRVKVTLSKDTYAVLQQLAELNERSMSALIGELVEAIAPSMRTTLDLLVAAHAADAKTKSRLIEAMDEIENSLVGALGAGTAQVNWQLQKAAAVSAAEEAPKQPKKRLPKGPKGSGKKGSRTRPDRE